MSKATRKSIGDINGYRTAYGIERYFGNGEWCLTRPEPGLAVFHERKRDACRDIVEFVELAKSKMWHPAFRRRRNWRAKLYVRAETPEPNEDGLLPCPFCGEYPSLSVRAGYADVQCLNLRCHSLEKMRERTREDCIKYWNKRPKS